MKCIKFSVSQKGSTSRYDELSLETKNEYTCNDLMAHESKSAIPFLLICPKILELGINLWILWEVVYTFESGRYCSSFWFFIVSEELSVSKISSFCFKPQNCRFSTISNLIVITKHGFLHPATSTQWERIQPTGRSRNAVFDAARGHNPKKYP